MKRFFHAVLVLSLALFAVSCSESNENGEDDKSIKLSPETKQEQQVYADDKQAPAPIKFTATAPWKATVSEVATKAEAGRVDWLELSKYEGEKGEVSINMTLHVNTTGQDRKAKIRIACGGTTIVITVEQKGKTESGEVPEDPDEPEKKTPLDANGNIQFPDAKFAAYMVENFDTNKDGGISPAEAAKITEIYCTSYKIESVEGIEYCTELAHLSCVANQLTTLDVSNNTKLTDLWCSENRLTSLDVSKNTELTVLYCEENQLTALDVSNTELTDLWCYENRLTSLDVSNNTKLARLWCEGNQLATLDVSNNTKLTELDCANNQLTTLNVSNNTALTDLECGNNQLTTLDISKNTELTDLWCLKNKLTTLDVSNNTKLTRLWCSENQLATLDVSRTRLGNSDCPTPLICYMTSLKTLWLKTGWVLEGINNGARDENYIHPNTEIKYKD